MLTPKQVEALETLIDQDDLASVLEHVSAICSEKAEHIRSNWQDESLATKWENAAAAVARAMVNPAVRVVSR